MGEERKKTVAIVDYEAGNLFSVEHACRIVGLKPVVTSEWHDLINADALILPGVGAFGDAMKKLRKMDLVTALLEFASSGKPFMGICLGMQLLFSRSEEFGEHEGLNLIEGNVAKLPSAGSNGEKVKVPQIGWNRIFQQQNAAENWNGTPLEQIANGEFMYFVHSFYVNPGNSGNILSLTNYGGLDYCSAVVKGNIFATRFHPEKSAEEGIKIYQYWASRTMDNKE